MNEILYIILFLFCIFSVIPFILYCIIVFIDCYDEIYYVRDYVDALKDHEMRAVFMIPVINSVTSAWAIIILISGIIRFIWNKIPRITIIETKSNNIWNYFVDWFMNIKIK